jgi:hypothetical protein
MAGNVHVIYDYQNIVLVDPNKIEDTNGNVAERLINHENMVMYANLEAKIVPRTKLIVGGDGSDNVRNVLIARINFLKPGNGDFLNSGYVDEITGLNSRQGKGVNQPKEETIFFQDNAYIKNTVNKNQDGFTVDNALLGITEISVTTNTSFIPKVTIQLEDVQGRALFAQGNESPYAAFYNLPYPPFYLTLKGYYGKAVRYELVLQKFNARYNVTSGNYMVQLEFYGYKFNILNEISIGSLFATPHMYSKRFEVKTKNLTPENQTKSFFKSVDTNIKQATNGDDSVYEVFSERGYEKVIEVYKEYKSKRLIDQDFPELTLLELMNKLEFFEQNILNAYSKVNVAPLTDGRDFKNNLNNYFNEIKGSASSWFNIYVNPKPFYLKDKSETIYRLKDEYLSPDKESLALSKLQSIIKKFNDRLITNESFGENRLYEIKNNITYETFTKNIDTLTDIDWGLSYLSQTGILGASEAEVERYKNSFIKIRVNAESKEPIKEVWIKGFDYSIIGSFSYYINNMENEYNQKISNIETSLSLDLSSKIEDKELGIGFKPTIRNIIAVIMASTEAFIRLMDEVHNNAWSVRYDNDRKSSVLKGPSSDDKDMLSSFDDNLRQVFPWPQVFVEKFDNKENRFQLIYPGDPSIINLTKAFLASKWPEVEFVEEYLKGLTQRFSLPFSQDPLINENKITSNLFFNAIEFPFENTPFQLKEEIKFFYEIWERHYLSIFYSGFYRFSNSSTQQDFINLVGEVEKNNIINILKNSSPFLVNKMKEYLNVGYFNGETAYVPLNQANYQDFLRVISNFGLGKSFQEFSRDIFVTKYIGSLLSKPYSILTIEDYTTSPNYINPIPENIKNGYLRLLSSTASNPVSFTDTYPYTNNAWSQLNIGGINQYDTNLSLFLDSTKNMVTNFDNLYNTNFNRPVTSFSYLNFINPLPSAKASFSSFYQTRTDSSSFLPTEGKYPLGALSMFNTPYFVNSILKGVNNWRLGNKNPYVEAAYLFLNSLPLAGISQKYKNNNNADNNYIFATLKKFGGLHKLPYVWILKYGSIWYRYKKFKREGIDILSDVWVNFDYANGFDPNAGSVSREYTFTVDSKEFKIFLQKEQTSETLSELNIQTGFYPKLINDFNFFLNGYDLYSSGYTNQDIQRSVDRGLIISNLSDSNISYGVGYDPSNVNSFLSLKTWSVLIPRAIDDSLYFGNPCAVNTEIKGDYYIIPSFGSSINEVNFRCFNNGQITENLINNSNVYNGSVRLLWGAPHYGYFNDATIRKPNPDEYLINSFNTQDAFNLSQSYKSIEDIFSVFSNDMLDIFENEFLLYSRSIYEITNEERVNIKPIEINFNDKNSIYRNFQLTMMDLLSVPASNPNESLNTIEKQRSFVSYTIENQINSLGNKISNIINYDVIFKNGNPNSHDRYIFDSFSNHIGGNRNLTGAYDFSFYTSNTLPSSNGGISLQLSRNANVNEWIDLDTYVGFSTIPNLAYSDNGSYITDFFIDNNVAFTSDNIKLLSPLVKIYATKKLDNPLYNSTLFNTDLSNYLSSLDANLVNALGITLDGVSGSLDNIEITSVPLLNSAVDSKQSKIELYDMFKAINDKWIAGGDYTSRTLFEDFLFLDRGSRNIGDKYLIDIFSLRKVLSKGNINLDSTVFLLVTNILIDNNFNVMPMPSYINFYNVQDVTENPSLPSLTDFANDFWGTFLEVDYRKSGPKMVCFYVEKPSTYVSTIDDKNYLFRDDAFNMLRDTDIPFLESQEGKNDWGLSNKCVGFIVDIGTRNQNIFYSFNVSQDNGKATTESLAVNYQMAMQASGRAVSTQNVSLYNIYKNLSYQCEIYSLGNAMIQPTMYFNLQHVPLFNGPYFITEVTHTISSGNFQTNFKGTRQGIFTLPTIDRYLQSINENLLTKIESRLNQKKDVVKKENPTNQDKYNAQPTDNKINKEAENTCVSLLSDAYAQYVSTSAINSNMSAQEMKDLIVSRTDDALLQTVMFSICYVSSYRNNAFFAYNNNFANINLTVAMSPTDSLFSPTYYCANLGDKNLPFASFRNKNDFISFLLSRIENNLGRISTINLENNIAEYYYRYFPFDKGITDKFYDAAKTNEIPQIVSLVKEAIKLGQTLGIKSAEIRKDVDSCE